MQMNHYSQQAKSVITSSIEALFEWGNSYVSGERNFTYLFDSHFVFDFLEEASANIKGFS